ncbi:MAG TPA: hypothetical protein VF150_10905, partial [Thermoanaerobaculia bacterium]
MSAYASFWKSRSNRPGRRTFTVLTCLALSWLVGCGTLGPGVEGTDLAAEPPGVPEERPRPAYEDLARFTAPLDRYGGFRKADLQTLRRQTVPPSAIPQREVHDWESIGPANYAGKVMDLDVHPTNPSVVYAAYMAGGVWKTTNAGASWEQATDIESQNYVST